ncbi:MAG TPA: class I SAM-dependent methyltransferase [Methylocystis sp.]|nr:class I SAM-dependent methyltransferase [Methylocystis sp.]
MSAAAAELMDRMYRPQRRIYDLTRKFYLLGRDRLIAQLSPPDGAKVLEIGCGTGRNLICAARRYPKAQFYGVDISTVMLEQAAASIERAGVVAKIALAKGDASTFDAAALFGEAKFERIFISYALSMIPPWRDTIAHALDLLAPGGELHIVDFGDQTGLPAWFKRVLRWWLALFHVSPREELAGEVMRQAEQRGLTCRHEPLYGGYAFYDVARK